MRTAIVVPGSTRARHLGGASRSLRKVAHREGGRSGIRCGLCLAIHAGMNAFLRAAIVAAQLLAVCVVSGAGAQPVPNDPPQIVFSTSPAILILIDGDPVYRTIDGTDLQRIVNTRSLIVRNAAGIYYLKLRKGWMESYLLTGWWTLSGTAPEGGAEAIRQAVNDKAVDLLNGRDVPDTDAGPLPTVYVYTTPAVLIVTDGPARFVPLEGTPLRYIENTPADVFEDPDGYLYVLTSGRWFRAPDASGPWLYIPSDDLPNAFARIPDNSPKARVKVR